MRCSAGLECAAFICFLITLRVRTKNLKICKTVRNQEATVRREKDSEPVCHTVKPWELRGLCFRIGSWLVEYFFLILFLWKHKLYWFFCNVTVLKNSSKSACVSKIFRVAVVYGNTFTLDKKCGPYNNPNKLRENPSGSCEYFLTELE